MKERNSDRGLLPLQFHVALTSELAHDWASIERFLGPGEAVQSLLLLGCPLDPQLIEELLVHHAVKDPCEFVIGGRAQATVLVEVLAQLVANLLD